MIVDEGELDQRSGPELLPLGSLCDPSDSLEGFAANLNRNLWMGHQIVIPGRVTVRTHIGGKDKQVLAIGQITQRRDAWFSTSGSNRREQEDGHIFQTTARFSPARTKLLDYAAIISNLYYDEIILHFVV